MSFSILRRRGRLLAGYIIKQSPILLKVSFRLLLLIALVIQLMATLLLGLGYDLDSLLFSPLTI